MGVGEEDRQGVVSAGKPQEPPPEPGARRQECLSVLPLVSR